MSFDQRRKINYIGWVGFSNVGDEALYLVNQSVFELYRLVPDVKKQHSRITIFGGGTTLPIWPSLVLPNKYNYAYGLGVRNPSFWKDYFSFTKVWFWVRRIRQFNFRYIGVRDKTSRSLLKQWGIDSKLIGDPCLLLRASSRKKDDTKIAINIGSDGYVWGGDEKRAFREIIELCKTLKKEGWNPILIPFHERDIKSIEIVSKKTNINFLRNLQNTQEILNSIASCRILIGERLHSLIFSSAAHTPFISIEYRPKCYSFAETVGFEKYNIRIDEMTAKKVMVLFNDLLDNWNKMHRHLVKNVRILRKKLEESAALIIRDMESLPDDKWSIPRAQGLKMFCHQVPYSMLNGLTSLHKRHIRTHHFSKQT